MNETTVPMSASDYTHTSTTGIQPYFRIEKKSLLFSQNSLSLQRMSMEIERDMDCNRSRNIVGIESLRNSVLDTKRLCFID